MLDNLVLFTRSTSMQRAECLLRHAAGRPINVVLAGEPGVGRTFAARWIHANSATSDGPFVHIDCGQPASILHDALFSKRSTSIFHPTTLLLANVTEMPAQIQAQASAIRMLYLYSSRCRLIVSGPSLRSRAPGPTISGYIAGILGDPSVIEIPALRERKRDIQNIVREMLERLCDKDDRKVPTVAADAMDALTRFDWPGNVPELEDAVRMALASAKKNRIQLRDLPVDVRRMLPDVPETPIETLAAVEKRHIVDVLRRCGGNRRLTADALGIGLNTLSRRLVEYGVARKRARRSAG